MNYVEWALQRGLELWREREEASKERLSQSLAVKSSGGTTEGDAAAERAGWKTSLPQAETVESVTDESAQGAMERLARKLGSGDGSGTFEQETEEGRSAPVGMTARAAAPSRGRNEENGESAAVWLRQELGKDMTAAAGIAAVRERDAFALSREREMRETESFSQSLERDARRYDGGFLFY